MKSLRPASLAALRFLSAGEATKYRIGQVLPAECPEGPVLDCAIAELLDCSFIHALQETKGLPKRFAITSAGRLFLASPEARRRGSRRAVDEWKMRVNSRFEAIFAIAQDVLLQYPPRDDAAIPATATCCNAQQPSSDDDDEWEEDGAQTNVCLSGEALDAWWAALPIDQKADAMTNHFEYHAALRQPVPPLTDAGQAHAAEEVEA